MYFFLLRVSLHIKHVRVILTFKGIMFSPILLLKYQALSMKLSFFSFLIKPQVQKIFYFPLSFARSVNVMQCTAFFSENLEGELRHWQTGEWMPHLERAHLANCSYMTRLRARVHRMSDFSYKVINLFYANFPNFKHGQIQKIVNAGPN